MTSAPNAAMNAISMHAWMMKRIGATAHPTSIIIYIQDRGHGRRITTKYKSQTTMYLEVRLIMNTPRYQAPTVRAGWKLTPTVVLRLGLKLAPTGNQNPNIRPRANLRPNNLRQTTNLRPTATNLRPTATNLRPIGNLRPTASFRPTTTNCSRPTTIIGPNHPPDQQAPHTSI